MPKFLIQTITPKWDHGPADVMSQQVEGDYNLVEAMREGMEQMIGDNGGPITKEFDQIIQHFKPTDEKEAGFQPPYPAEDYWTVCKLSD